MRDGVLLSADIYAPRGKAGRFPVILYRTPYDNLLDWIVESCIFYAQHGYVAVAEDVRGRYDSQGEFYPWTSEFNDGYDTIEWIGKQPWCDGNVGMAGASYVGYVQWQAAVMGSRYLKTIVPRVMGHQLHESPHYQGGAFGLGVNATWSFRTTGRTMQRIDGYQWQQLFSTLPLKDLTKAAGKTTPQFNDWIDHPDYDDYWKALAIEERFEDIKVPAFQIGGWYDLYAAGFFEFLNGVKKRGGSPAARRHQKLLIGPWVHTACVNQMTAAGEVDFGKSSLVDFMQWELRWMDRWLKGVKNGVENDAPLRIFVMGTNQWRDEHEWPLARTKFSPWYFHSGGSANSLLGDGKLSIKPPTQEQPDRFAYNPMFPVPTRGGCNCCNPEIVAWGAYDQRSVEHRNDVLVYTSDPMTADMEVTGPVVVKLHAATDCRDTDFTAKLVDVHPHGYARNLCDGIIRGRYRESTAKQRLLSPGQSYEFTIDLWPTSNVFVKGHRIRVEISSSNFPRFDRNLNTGGRFGYETEMRTANQTVYHDRAHPSHILLPVVPKRA
jgi:putative CocE/NonD family hydrolase